jgi:hypothetical protein
MAEEQTARTGLETVLPMRFQHVGLAASSLLGLARNSDGRQSAEVTELARRLIQLGQLPTAHVVVRSGSTSGGDQPFARDQSGNEAEKALGDGH